MLKMVRDALAGWANLHLVALGEGERYLEANNKSCATPGPSPFELTPEYRHTTQHIPHSPV